ncbi:GFA family protein [Stutzerimonas balearica]|uniref:GFA family protein n=1 Tax=Stutzerimonas balearica TaxID=74829 RepID=A0A9X7V5R0_9GAMM|nr:GFA family protein [Stutzerimonas balearica]QIJ01522.1 GFA family protein [Stutzerimonas balearica]QQN51779.1 GFA family protein [Stutzerimonas balearica]
MQTHTGSCLCGVVRYRIDAPINAVSHCHCKMCRKAHGAAFASYAGVPLDAFHLLSGKDQLGVYHSSEHVTRTFCIRCGSNLQFVDNREHELGVAVGTLDSPLPPPAQSHIYVGSKADWYEIGDDLPQYPADS